MTSVTLRIAAHILPFINQERGWWCSSAPKLFSFYLFCINWCVFQEQEKGFSKTRKIFFRGMKSNKGKFIKKYALSN